MAITKEELEKKIVELAQKVDDSVVKLDRLFKTSDTYLTEIKKRGRHYLEKAKPAFIQKRFQLELYWLNKRLSLVKDAIRRKKGEESEANEGSDTEEN